MQGNSGYRTNFYYDGARRARRELISKGGSSWDRNETWEFNPANQVTAQTQDNSLHHWTGHPAQTIDKDYTANGLNQYTQVSSETLSYDANGNLIADGFNSFTYDVENRLVAVSGQNNAELAYDPLGRLYEVRDGNNVVQRVNLYDGDALIGEYGNSGTMIARYVHGLASGDDPIAAWTDTAALSPSLANVAFLYRDRLGSVVMSSTDGATGQTAYTYDEFGVHGTNTPPRFGYTGQVYVPEAGLYYYKARMYSPGLGRFMQADPIGFAAGMNWYAYVGNDPVNAVDPSGLFACIVDGEPIICVDGVRLEDAPSAANLLGLRHGDRSAGRRGNSERRQGDRQSPRGKTRQRIPCAEALLEDGAIVVGSVTGSIGEIVGVTGATGFFINVETGTMGLFGSVGAGGVAGGEVGIQPGVYARLSRFAGSALNVGVTAFGVQLDLSFSDDLSFNGGALGVAAGAQINLSRSETALLICWR